MQSRVYIPDALPKVLREWEEENSQEKLRNFLLFTCSSPSLRVAEGDDSFVPYVLSVMLLRFRGV